MQEYIDNLGEQLIEADLKREELKVINLLRVENNRADEIINQYEERIREHDGGCKDCTKCYDVIEHETEVKKTIRDIFNGVIDKD